MKAASDRDLSVGGPGLAAAAIRAGLVDELHRFVVPEIVGGGTSFLPQGVRRGLELVDERRFPNGTVFLHYRVEA
jgi:riboflavin biosynthesis pyrimidine reductase